MEKQKFEALLILIVPQVVQLIVKNHQCDEITATKAFYESKVYALLEEEETKMWHYSPLTLFNMYDSEIKTGEILFPEG